MVVPILGDERVEGLLYVDRQQARPPPLVELEGARLEQANAVDDACRATAGEAVEDRAHHRQPPADQPERDDKKRDRRAQRRREHGAQRLGQPEGHEHRHQAEGDEGGDRQRVQEVLDGERRGRRADGRVAADEGDLGRLADQDAERRDVAERVARQRRREGRREPQARRRLEAEHPGQGAGPETQAAERHDGEEPPADLARALHNRADAGPPDEVDEQREAQDRRGGASEGQPPGAGRGARRGRDCRGKRIAGLGHRRAGMIAPKGLETQGKSGRQRFAARPAPGGLARVLRVCGQIGYRLQAAGFGKSFEELSREISL